MFIGAATRRVKAASSKGLGADLIPDRSYEVCGMNNGSSFVGAVDLPWSRHRVESAWFGVPSLEGCNLGFYEVK